jgi:HPt (histidine-containing phosphotransfer) domain-containing protein
MTNAGYDGCGSAGPIDFEHLARQTMGDVDLQAEILGMFSAQLSTVLAEMGKPSGRERWRLAHGLKGTARGVGAFALAECAERIERDPDDDDLLETLRRLAEESRHAMHLAQR